MPSPKEKKTWLIASFLAGNKPSGSTVIFFFFLFSFPCFFLLLFFFYWVFFFFLFFFFQNLQLLIGPVGSFAYSLEELDYHSSKQKGSSALMLMVYPSTQANVDRKPMLEMTPFKEILKKKWEKYAQWIFYISIIWYIIYLIAICFVVIRPFSGDWSILLTICEVFIIVTAGSNLFFEFYDLYFLTMKRYFSNIGQFPFFSVIFD